MALARMRASMRAFYRLIGEGSPGGEVFEAHGVLASIAPSCPDRSVVNAVVYDDGAALAAAREELQAAYERAGVRAWTVWVPEADAPAAALLRSAGHVHDASPRAMLLPLSGADLDGGAGEIDWERTDEASALARINEEAYGLPGRAFGEVMSALTGSEAALYLARSGGRPAACVVTVTAEGDCGVFLVATTPAAQRRGLAMALMRQALWDARDAGASTSSLQATQRGRPLYERLGYRDLGAIEMWELRS